jgi:hypothetical protein
MRRVFLSLLLVSFGSIACMTGHWESASKSSTFALDLVQTWRACDREVLLHH